MWLAALSTLKSPIPFDKVSEEQLSNEKSDSNMLDTAQFMDESEIDPDVLESDDERSHEISLSDSEEEY